MLQLKDRRRNAAVFRVERGIMENNGNGNGRIAFIALLISIGYAVNETFDVGFGIFIAIVLSVIIVSAGIRSAIKSNRGEEIIGDVTDPPPAQPVAGLFDRTFPQGLDNDPHAR